MGFIIRSLLLFALLAPLYAADKKMYIIVGSFLSEKRAQARLAYLQEEMERQEYLVGLRDDYGFAYSIKRAGAYHRIAIGPFDDVDVLQPVIDKTRETYKDAFVSRYAPQTKAAVTAVASSASDVSRPQEAAAIKDWSKQRQVGQDTLETAAGESYERDHGSGALTIAISLLIVIILLIIFIWRSRKKKEKVEERSVLDMYDFEP